MAVAIRGTATTATKTNGGGGGVATVNKPTGVQDGDILVFIVGLDDPVANVTPPAGMGGTIASIDGASSYPGLIAYWKRAAGEGASYDFAFTQDGCVVCVAYSGCRITGTPVGNSSTNTATSGTTLTATGITQSVNNAQLMAAYCWETTAGASVPTDMAELADITSTQDSKLAVFDQLGTLAGAIAAKTTTVTGSDHWCAILFELLPATEYSAQSLACTGSDDSGVGTVAWTNPTSANTANSVGATAVLGNTVQSHYLKAVGFGFAIPANAVITGITVETNIRNATGSTSCLDNRMRIVKAGSIGATDKAIAGNYPSSYTYRLHGAANDLWGETWTPADINDATFGCALSAKGSSASSSTANCDNFRVTVYYTIAPSLLPRRRSWRTTQQWRAA